MTVCLLVCDLGERRGDGAHENVKTKVCVVPDMLWARHDIEIP